MNLNVVVSIVIAILTAAGINTNNINIDDIVSKVNIEEQTNENNTEINCQLNEDNSTYDNEDNSEEKNVEVDEELTLDEKYNHNQNRENQSDNEEDIWYDVPRCEDHDFTVTEYSDGGGYGVEYICNKCGYSYTEPITEEQFMESLINE